MAGRDGLVDTAIKTSRSGYLQRCLVKNLESLKVCYDYTVRDADGSIVQFAYGDDGVDVLKTSYITEVEALSNNQRVVLESLSSQLEDAHLSKPNRFIKDLPDSLKEIATSYANQLSKSKRGHIRRKDLMRLMKLKYMSSLAAPGEPVGVIAAQSVGEPSTQMTLNTFHLAGRGEMNVTLGIPRLQEILMSAKEVIRTPIMTCPLLDGMTKEDGECLAAKLRRICVADIVESMEVSTLPFYIHNRKVSTLYKLKMKLFPPSLYPPHTDISLQDCRSILRTTFVEAMEVAITRHLELISKISDIDVVAGKGDSGMEEEGEDGSGSKSANGDDIDGGGGGGEKDEDDEFDDDGEDQGADAEKRKKQMCDEMDYEDEMEKKSSSVVFDEFGGESETDQVEEAEDDYELGGDDPDIVANKKINEDDPADNVADEETPESPSKTKTLSVSSSKVKKSKAKPKIVKRKKKIDSAIFVKAEGLRFEAHFVLVDKPHILLAEIAQTTAKRVYLKECEGIDRCSVVEPKRSTDRIALQTSGVNFGAFWDLQDNLDVKKIVTNDIHAVLNTYGVEAARQTIINEVKGVFDPYGIRVNTRHLSLIADFMSSNGGYRPMNRLGMMQFNTSPFGKMTFETATKFIVEAAFHGESDVLESPSAQCFPWPACEVWNRCF
ncbi:uncharacterized protein A4U43_C05F30570 [Asparagus officinalis]|uniref:DNA-directed RNA polymerase n=1 Tax=Asparagus officinalis TaxID=4686 RepID=A0A5P1F131_ASPOF|nr:uncharacterized protein A4U43_C05F30570 [Asparagus officinalis]